MVHKIRFIILFLILCVLGAFSFFIKGNVETNLLKTLLPQRVIESTDIVRIADKTSSDIKVVFEADNLKKLSELKELFIKSTDNNYFELLNFDFSKLINIYLNSPANFLSYETRNLLKNKKYDEVYSSALERIYNPINIQLSTFEKDPYLLADDFINSLPHISKNINNENEKIYDYLILKIKSQEGLSPDLANKKISELVKIQKELSKSGNKIYLAGNPIHSYYASRKAVIGINLICILSVLLISFLTYYYFKTFTPLLPIGLCILCGILAGYDVTKLWFKDFQVITMVFSSTLIGIGIDYSYHYLFNGNDKNFKKNLMLSFVTTVIPFTLLYFTGIELLKQISVFSVFGLLAIYFIVLIIYPASEELNPIKTFKFDKKIAKTILTVLGILSIIGFLRFNFNDSLTSLYTPSKELLKAENLYNSVSGNLNTDSQFIEVQGNNLQELLETEEKITDRFKANNINFVSLSLFTPSEKRQKENFELVQNLYKNSLSNFSDILSNKQIQILKEQTFIPVKTELQAFSTLSQNFMLDKNTSLIVIKSSDKINAGNVINLKSDISEYMKNYRDVIVKILPIALLVIFIILTFFYGVRWSAKILFPSVCGIIGALGLTLLIFGEINVFSLIALFMVLGFTMDYSIFRKEENERTEDAILVSASTTAFSFFLLSFCGFKLLSSISLVLFFGILISYLTGFLIKEKM